MERRTRIAIMVALAVVIIALLVIQADPSDVASRFRTADLWILASVVALYLLNTLAKAIRWYALLTGRGHTLPLGRVALYFMVGLSVNNVTPGRVAGEPVRAYLLRAGEDHPMGRGMASIFLEKAIDTMVTILLALLGILLLVRVIPPSATVSLALSAGMVALLMGAILVFIAFPSGPRRLAQWSFDRLRRRGQEGRAQRLEAAVTGFLTAFEGGTREISRDRPRTVVATVLTVFIWLNEAVRLWLVFLALGSNVSFELMMVAATLASFAALLIPLGAGNSTAIVVICVLAGIDGDLATSASLLAIMTSIWLSVPLGAAAMTVAGVKMDRLPSLSELVSGGGRGEGEEGDKAPSDGGAAVEAQPRP